MKYGSGVEKGTELRVSIISRIRKPVAGVAFLTPQSCSRAITRD